MLRSPLLLPLALVLTSVAAAQDPGRPAPRGEKAPEPPPLPVLGQGATEALAAAFAAAEHWSLQAIALLSLGRDWHPVGAGMVVAALQSKEARLVPFGLETLRRMDDAALQRVATPALVGELIGRQLKAKNELVQQRALEVLGRMVPGAGARDRGAWQAWWRDNEQGHAPPAWQPPADQPRGGTVSTMVERAFDLRDAGLEVCIVIDSTGSMQIAINTARDAVGDVVALLAGIAPKMKLGLVHYKDFGDLSDGAKVLAPLSKDVGRVRERLDKLIASGGGDVPERVEKGIELALSKAMGWDKDANRLILVIGDAPPHPETQSALLAVVKAAHEAPFTDPRRPTTGKREKLRPFIISTIATHQQAKVWFDEIAAAGGGTSVLLPIDDKGRDRAVQAIARHVMGLAFGAQYERQVAAFADTFFEYRAAGAF